MLPFSAGSFGVNRYADVWRRIGALETLDNTVKCGVILDNGVALAGRQTLGPIASAEYSLRVAFTESQAPAMADSDARRAPRRVGDGPARARTRRTSPRSARPDPQGHLRPRRLDGRLPARP